MVCNSCDMSTVFVGTWFKVEDVPEKDAHAT
jgi:hypothetical protein